MNPRVPLLVVLAGGLVAVVAVVAHGRPLAAGAGQGGLSSSFWHYTVTSIVLLLVVTFVALIALVIAGAPMPENWKPPPHARAIWSIVALALFICVAFVLRRFINFGHVLRRIEGKQQTSGPGGAGGHAASGNSTTWFQWNEAGIVLGILLLALLVWVVVARRREGARPRDLPTPPERVAAALDDSLDDLRNDPDLRRAIIAAYARMETALASLGIPRRPAEAPLEYLERALLSLDTSGPAVRRLTDLFEWAKFSHHEPEPAMRDEAVEALVALRDELRAPLAVAA